MFQTLKNKSAFTLAEVLITLGIIGVVSALTIPTLVQNYQKKTFVTQLHKVYNELSNAAIRAANDSNATSLNETIYINPDNGAKLFLEKYFKVIKSCDKSLTPCFASGYQKMDGTDFPLMTPKYVATINSGTAISFFESYFTYSDEGQYHGYWQIQVDTNGAQGPNILGRDLFYLELYSDGKVAERYSSEGLYQERFCSEDNESSNEYGLGCLSQIIKDGWKMTY